MNEFVTTTEAADRAGVTYRQVDYWITHGLIRTSDGDPKPGSGTWRYLTASEAQVLQFLALLVHHGIPPAVAAPIARDIQSTGRARLGLFTITLPTPTTPIQQEESTAA